MEALATGNLRWRNAKTVIVSTAMPSVATALLSKMLGQAEVLTTMPLYTLASGAPMANGNSCGVVGRFTFSAARSGYSYTATPNLASTDLTVTSAEESQSQMAITSANSTSATRAPFNADLYDAHGRKVKTNHSNHGKAVLDVRDLPEGLYVLRSGSSKDVYSEHIQITH